MKSPDAGLTFPVTDELPASFAAAFSTSSNMFQKCLYPPESMNSPDAGLISPVAAPIGSPGSSK